MADLTYAIDIASSMPNGEKTVSQLAALSNQLIGAGVSADTLHDAVVTVANALDAAKSATASANAALSAGNAELKALERAAKDAGKAQAEAAKLGVVPPEVAASAAAASQAVLDHAEKLDRLRASVKAANAEEKQLAATLKNAQQAASAGTKALAEQEAAQKKASAEAEKATRTAREITGTEKWFKLNEAMGSTQGQTLLLAKGAAVAATAVVGVSIAIAAVTIAALAGVAALTSWAIGLADAKREAGLLAEASAALNPELASMRGLFDSVTAETGLATKKLEGLTQKLKDAGVPAGAMAGALRDAALAERALGDGGADPFIADIKAAKGAVTGLSNEVRGKLGVVVSKQMMGLSAQSERLKKNVSSIFGGLNIEPALAGLQRLVGLFEESSAAGQAIKFLFESVFQPLVDQAEAASVAVEAFALGFLIGLTKVYIGAKPYIKGIQEFFGFEDSSLTDTLDSAKAAGELLAPVFIGLVAGLTAMIAIIGVVVAVALLPLAVAAAQVYVAFQVITGVIDIVSGAFDAVVGYLNGIIPGFGDLGSQIIQGMINGILGGASGVLGAITSVATGAIKAAKSALGIKSPSTVFADIGGYTAEGFAQGVDDGAGAAQAAMTAMVEPPAPGETTAAAMKAGTSAGAASATEGEGPGASAGAASGGWSGDLILQFPNVSDTSGVKEMVEEVVTRIWEGDAAALGAEAAP